MESTRAPCPLSRFKCTSVAITKPAKATGVPEHHHSTPLCPLVPTLLHNDPEGELFSAGIRKTNFQCKPRSDVTSKNAVSLAWQARMRKHFLLHTLPLDPTAVHTLDLHSARSPLTSALQQYWNTRPAVVAVVACDTIYPWR